MILNSHPYWHIRAILEKRPDIKSVFVSRYSYLPQTVKDERIVWSFPSMEFLKESAVEEIIESTPKNQELAFHSNVTLDDGSTKHFTMVDMSTSSKAHLEKLRSFLGENLFQGISWFKSGRSFHGYGEDLLSQNEWVKLMGLLLLANKPNMEPTVDPRWIGHRLLAGFSSLRWTNNTSFYLISPKKIQT